ncbi:MAG: pseudaminic acid biosynthesis-associated methylase [Sulfurospirillaceae bacterium]|nr:pseudaminic acid biosynthesis-associated methylase [Sulfurospirillaceae bacterium]MDD2826868.1 pseudaminic acid biosynthesis-associated methylase [Sulfurospirillaceae bacterium]
MKNYKTEQEEFWAGQFGDEYILRNNEKKIIASNIVMFSKILSRTQNVTSILEFGSNIGLNLHALSNLLPNVELSAIEINSNAVKELKKIDNLKIYHQSILDFTTDYQRDFSLIKGVLIHINPDELQNVYEKIYTSSKKYICLVEYYNPTPVEIPYRNHEGKLFKRDFAGEMMDIYSDLELIDYGFTYHRDPVFPQGDATWFLMKKSF